MLTIGAVVALDIAGLLGDLKTGWIDLIWLLIIGVLIADTVAEAITTWRRRQ